MTERRDERGDREGRRSLQQELSKEPDELLENKEPISRKIEKVTEELLSEWEISEDDFEETGTAAAGGFAQPGSSFWKGYRAKGGGSQRRAGGVCPKAGTAQRRSKRQCAGTEGCA